MTLEEIDIEVSKQRIKRDYASKEIRRLIRLQHSICTHPRTRPYFSWQKNINVKCEVCGKLLDRNFRKK